jgi:hypothetical protein
MANNDDKAAVLPQMLGVLRELLELARTESQMRQAATQAELAEAQAELAEAQRELAELRAHAAVAQAAADAAEAQAAEAAEAQAAAEAKRTKKKKKKVPMRIPVPVAAPVAARVAAPVAAPVAAEEFRAEDVERWRSGDPDAACSSSDAAAQSRWEAQTQAEAQRRGKRKRVPASAAPRKKEYVSALEEKHLRMACETSGLTAEFRKRWWSEEFRRKVAQVRACGGGGNFRLLVDALQYHMGSSMQADRFMAELEEFVQANGSGPIAAAAPIAAPVVESDAGSDTEVDSNL